MKVHAAAALAQCAAQRRVRPDVGRGVGDGDIEDPALAGDLRVQRVVDVLRTGGVDGDEVEALEILAPRVVEGAAAIDERLCRRRVRLVPVGAQPVLGHDVAVLDARFVGGTDTFQHLGLRPAVADRVAQQGAAQEVALARAGARLRRQKQPAAQLWQVRLHEQNLALAHAAAGELAERAVDEAVYLRHRALVLGGPDSDGDAIAGKRLEHLVRRHEDFTPVVEAGEAVAPGSPPQHRLCALLLGLHLLLESLKLVERLIVEHVACFGFAKDRVIMLAQSRSAVRARRPPRTGVDSVRRRRG